MNAKEKPAYFNDYTQVKFKAPTHYSSENIWLGGIGYNDIVICGCCGKVIRLKDITECEKLPWINISEEILGDDC